MSNHSITLPIEKESVIAVGLMSGTSVDGIDAALVKITGSSYDTRVELLSFYTCLYEESIKQQVFAVCEPATSSVDQICYLNVMLGEKMAEAALTVINQGGLSVEDVDFISSHGQTIYHLPDRRATLQIGELAVIAKKTGCLTVGDFRPCDMAVGGQGAPLVPFVDQLLFRHEERGRILLNIGGMSNLTVLPPGCKESNVVAFDTGPGNVIIDEVVRIGTGGRLNYDNNGLIAAYGTIQEKWLKQIVDNDTYVALPFPKSTGREYYNRQLAEKLWADGNSKGYSFEDIVSTVAAYTVRTIAIAIEDQLDSLFEIDEILVGGGGTHNGTLMNGLKAVLQRPVLTMESVGIASDAKEAVAFAILGNEFLRQKPNTIPSATGANNAVSMGKLVLPF